MTQEKDEDEVKKIFEYLKANISYWDAITSVDTWQYLIAEQKIILLSTLISLISLLIPLSKWVIKTFQLYFGTSS